MNTKMNWDLFEKVEIGAGRRRFVGKVVSITKDKRTIVMNAELAKEAKLKVGDRFDLYRVGKTFALKKADVGVLKVANNGSAFVIRSTNACIEILALNGGCYKNEAWVEDGVIFFKPIEKVGE